MGGTVVIIGAVSGMGGGIVPRSLIGPSIRVQGIYVGSRQMHEDLARFVEVARITPTVDRVFAFGEAPEAFRHFEAGRHFGKVALKVG
jgi:NADPH:quinone reductase-like Zn-dependent oxidoreductase